MTDINNQDINNRNTAPVAVFVYKRADHTEELLQSLAACSLAKETDVFIFADGQKPVQDLEVFERDAREIKQVRSLINDSKWTECFRSLAITEAESNRGLANSIIAGVTEVVNRYGRIIVLEDDLVVARDFLQYMNAALDYFENDKDKFAITGWSYPAKSLDEYKKDAWLFYRACSWGWGTWSDRWNKVEFDPKKADFEGKLKDSAWCDKFTRGGNDLPGMLRLQLDGKRDSWAIRWNAAAADLDMMTVYPKQSRIMNNGRDGSGTHCGEAAYTQSDIQDLQASNQDSAATGNLRVPEYDFSNIVPDKRLMKQAWYFESDTIDKKIRRNLRKIFVEHKVPDFIKKKVTRR